MIIKIHLAEEEVPVLKKLINKSISFDYNGMSSTGKVVSIEESVATIELEKGILLDFLVMEKTELSKIH